MRILLDMDGVVADFMTPWLEQYNELTGEGVKLSDITGPDAAKFVGDPYLLKRIKDSCGFMRALKPLPGAIDGVAQLHSDGHDIVFVSNGTNCPTSMHEKRDWLKFYFHRQWKYVPLVLTYHKYLVRGDVLLEDTPRNLEKLEHGTKGLLYHHKYNAQETRFERIYDWSHFLQWVDENKDRYET